jgi:hypothetical protein
MVDLVGAASGDINGSGRLDMVDGDCWKTLGLRGRECGGWRGQPGSVEGGDPDLIKLG